MKRAVVLAIVSWVLALMALMLMGLAHWWTNKTAFYYSRYNVLTEHLDAKKELAVFIDEYNKGTVDHYLENEDEKKIYVTYRSANTRFDINKVPYEFIYSLLKELDFRHPKDLAAAICAWRGDKESKNVDRKAFDYFLRDYECKKDNFKNINELSFVKGIEKENPAKLKKLKELLRVSGDGRINVNEVSPIVLAAYLEAIRDKKKTQFDSLKLAEFFVMQKNRDGIILKDYKEFEQYLRDVMDSSWDIDFQNSLRINFSYLSYSSAEIIIDVKKTEEQIPLLKVLYDSRDGKIKYLESLL